MIVMPTPSRPIPVEDKLESLLDRLEGALDRTERKIANQTFRSDGREPDTESKDETNG